MTALRSTARLQFHRGFTFEDAAALVDYFAALGVSHLYASPITTAQPGSTHGYDTVDYARVNPELGGEAALGRLVAKLRAHRMGLVVDIVPNHMGVGGAHNAWWLDILTWGRHSEFARYFDVDWHSPDPALRGKVLAPFLGGPYGEELQARKIVLGWDSERAQFLVEYGPHRFPICPTDYASMFRTADAPALAPLIESFHQLGSQPEDRPRAAAAHERLRAFATDAGRRSALDAVLEAHAAPEVLHRLLERQHFRLAWWRTASDEVNWRRFFDISALIGMRVERPEVFEASHALIFRLYAQGEIDGVRVDHVDGLAEPREYCQRLRLRLDQLRSLRPAGLREEPAPLVVEKILARDEPMRTDWGIDGTTGYDFMDQVGALLHDPSGAAPLEAWWRALPGASALSFEAQALRAKRQMLAENLAAEVDRSTRALHRIARDDIATRDNTFGSIKRVLTEYVVHFPVYRIYPENGTRSAEDNRFFDRAREGARAQLRHADEAMLERLDGWLGGSGNESGTSIGQANGAGTTPASAGGAPAYPTPAGSHRRAALIVFSQLTSPTAAKAVEDTVCYRYGRLLSRNEVGANPSEIALTPGAFHEVTAARARDFPRAWLTTATHDHKRGEDTRARLAVISEIPERWAATVAHWRSLNAVHKTPRAKSDARMTSGAQVSPLSRSSRQTNPATSDDGLDLRDPEASTEAMLYEALVGAWPLDLSPEDAQGVQSFGERVAAWLEKALREAKLRTDWFTPNAAYETACHDFLLAILAPSQRQGFLGELALFVGQIAAAGAINSLQQTLLRLASPGIADLYQGTELWDFSMVDPDNRRPVDFALRRAALEAGSPAGLLADWRDGRVKLAIIRSALALRTRHPDLFVGGDYLPLVIKGPMDRHAIAFARMSRMDGSMAIAVASRLPGTVLGNADQPIIKPSDWADTRLVIPELVRDRFTDVLADHAFEAAASLPLSEVLAALPVALLSNEGSASQIQTQVRTESGNT
ncbi:malto-oligosyltrehalose synthase [Pararobbsia alpina]|uniref:Maltooligosyl trehalose synthase n=1 Tax=Pararobbsia alpina TaxID=621374 RepID=A0A6S7B2Q4_9BURK|nr:malto-oligosyltrehalose synthase [Pararobbsia alpina]CAB3786012.1 Maltooligosyl trehalose synthase [Pararobbsia alpina]